MTKPPTLHGLKPVEQIFCEMYLRYRDPEMAMRDAREQVWGRDEIGSTISVRSAATKAMNNPLVRDRIEALHDQVISGLQIDTTWMLQNLKAALLMDPQDLLQRVVIKAGSQGKNLPATDVITNRYVYNPDIPPEVRRMISKIDLYPDGTIKSITTLNKTQILAQIQSICGMNKGTEAERESANALATLLDQISSSTSERGLLQNDSFTIEEG